MICIFIALPSGYTAYAVSVEQVISTSPSWPTFTNKNGTGLYHEILSEIFTPLGIKVVHKYTNAVRGMVMLQKEQADFYTCKNEIDKFKGLVLARYPMYAGKYHAIFKKNKFMEWQGQESLTDRTVVWRRGYYNASDFNVKFKPMEADSGSSALSQIIFDRCDFYIDDLTLIKESISKNTFPFDMNEYRIEPVGSRSYYPVFKNTQRGKAIMELYDKGIFQLHKSGRLKAIFDKWHHPYPDYDAF